jgi:hypothetical protein
MFLSECAMTSGKTLVTDILAAIGNILSGRPAFSQAYDFNKGPAAPANSYWPNLGSIGPLSGYVDAYYPDINTIPMAQAANTLGRDIALNNTLPFQSYLLQTMDAQGEAPKYDMAGNNSGGDDDGGYYYNNNPYAPLQPPMASFSRITMP